VIAASTTRTGRRILAIAAAASLSLALVAPAFAAEPVIGPGGIPPTTTTVTVFLANSGGTVNIPQNGVVRIVLPYNPSTGFQWVTVQAPDPTILQALEPNPWLRSPAGTAPLVGHRGNVVWQFAGLATGTTQLALDYDPPGPVGPSEHFRLSVTVRGTADATLTESDCGAVVGLPLEASISLTLPSNASTGYSWQFQKNPNPRILLASTLYGGAAADPGTMPGAWSSTTFSMSAVGQGATSYKLAYTSPDGHSIARTCGNAVFVGPNLYWGTPPS
jgi:predicted secreted protein